MLDLSSLVSGGIFSFALIFARIGGALMTMPGFSSAFVAPQIRLFLALMLSLLIHPVVSDLLPVLPVSPIQMSLLIGGELLIGLFLGTFVSLLTSALEIGGRIIAHHTGMANANILNPQLEIQSSLPGVLLSIVGLVLIFTTNLHHLMIGALVRSYLVFMPGQMPDTGDMALTIAQTSAKAIRIGAEIAAPFIMVSFTFFVALGLLARLMPQVQIFFVSLPAQVALGLMTFFLAMSSLVLFWLDRFQQGLTTFMGL